MLSGETSTPAWPIAVAASAALSEGTGTEPPNASSPGWIGLPSPNCDATVGRLAACRWSTARLMKAVLHDSAKAARTVAAGESPSALWNGLPSTVTSGGQLAGDDAVGLAGIGSGQRPDTGRDGRRPGCLLHSRQSFGIW